MPLAAENVRTHVADSSLTGKPSSPSSIAGVRICSRLNFPLPNLSIASTHPAAAPGTVTASALRGGILPLAEGAMPSSLLTCSRVVFFGLRPEPLRACTFFVLASKNRQNMSPPIPVEDGSVMFNAAAMEGGQTRHACQTTQEHTDSDSSILHVLLVMPRKPSRDSCTYCRITTHLQYPLPGFRCQRLRACDHALCTMDHTPPARKLDKRSIWDGKYGFRLKLFRC